MCGKESRKYAKIAEKVDDKSEGVSRKWVSQAEVEGQNCKR